MCWLPSLVWGSCGPAVTLSSPWSLSSFSDFGARTVRLALLSRPPACATEAMSPVPEATRVSCVQSALVGFMWCLWVPAWPWAATLLYPSSLPDCLPRGVQVLESDRKVTALHRLLKQLSQSSKAKFLYNPLNVYVCINRLVVQLFWLNPDWCKKRSVCIYVYI